VFPNPVVEEVVFDVKNISGRTTLEIYSTDGKLVFDKTWSAQGRELVPVSLKKQPTGVYFWQIRTEGGAISGRLVKG